jgi:hypothetical protein
VDEGIVKGSLDVTHSEDVIILFGTGLWGTEINKLFFLIFIGLRLCFSF